MVEENRNFPKELYSEIHKSLVPASMLAETQFRLDAPAFLSRNSVTTLITRASTTKTLGEMADVFTVYIQSPVLVYVRPFSNSRPYLTTSELAEFQTGRPAHVSLLADPRLIGWEIKEGNIVVSRSGRVGEAYWVDRRLDGVLVGDSFRVVSKNPEECFVIYAVLASAFARNYLSGNAYGSVVDHASLDQLRAFPMPSLPPDIHSKITQKVRRALSLRDQAYDLLDESQKQVLKSNALARRQITSSAPVDSYEQPMNTYIPCNEVASGSDGDSEFRLEAHFHNPIARAAIENIRNCPSKRSTVGQLSHQVILAGRFKRNYVKAEYGTPFLSGKNIVQIRPTDVKYLSNSETEDLKDCLLTKGWVLVTRSGTIGRTCFVWYNFEDYAASEHILRVIPNEELVDPGYFYAFLSSPYGYEQIIRFRHGSVIDEITDEQLKKVIVPLPGRDRQKEIGDNVRLAYEKRAEAIRLEDEAQSILMREIQQQRSVES